MKFAVLGALVLLTALAPGSCTKNPSPEPTRLAATPASSTHPTVVPGVGVGGQPVTPPADRLRFTVVILVTAHGRVPVARTASVTFVGHDRKGQPLPITDPQTGHVDMVSHFNLRGQPVAFVVTYEPGTSFVDFHVIIPGDDEDVAFVRAYDFTGREITPSGQITDRIRHEGGGVMRLTFTVVVSPY